MVNAGSRVRVRLGAPFRAPYVAVPRGYRALGYREGIAMDSSILTREAAR
jgi:hypothetical protein